MCIECEKICARMYLYPRTGCLVCHVCQMCQVCLVCHARLACTLRFVAAYVRTHMCLCLLFSHICATISAQELSTLPPAQEFGLQILLPLPKSRAQAGARGPRS